MKILQVNCVYKHGSTGKIVADIHNVLQLQAYESVICYGRGKDLSKSEPFVYKFCSELESNAHHFAHRYLGAFQYGGCFFSTRKLISIIKTEKPDVVHIHCINGYCVNIYKLLEYLGNNRIKTLVSNHAEFYYTGNCGHAFDCANFTQPNACQSCPDYRSAIESRSFNNAATAWKKMKNAFSKFSKENLLFTAVSPWVKKRFAMSPITNQFDCKVVENGVEVGIFHRWEESTCSSIRREIGIPQDAKMVFHATASFTLAESSIKGGRYIYELAKRMPDVYFVVAALQNTVPNDCPSNLILMGATKTQEHLARLYSAANLTVITSRRETFSMITAESQCCGTPVLGFEAGGPESIAISAYAEFVKYGDMDTLQQCIINWLQKDNINRKELEMLAQQRFSKEAMTAGYVSCYNQLVSR